MMLRSLIPVVVILVTASAERATIPNYIHICNRSDPQVARCIRDSVEALKPRLKTGIPELNVPPLEPLLIEDITVYRGDDNSHFKAALKNVRVLGSSNFDLSKLKVNLEKNVFRVGLKIPLLELDGEYDVEARILVVPIRGSGRFVANITDVEANGVLKAELFERDGYRQIRFTSFTFAIGIGDYYIDLENLFNSDPVIRQAANEVLTESKQDFIEAALPFIQSKAAEILLAIAKQITINVDYDEIFPE